MRITSNTFSTSTSSAPLRKSREPPDPALFFLNQNVLPLFPKATIGLRLLQASHAVTEE